MKSLPEVVEDAASLEAPLPQRLAYFDRGLREIAPAWSAAYDELVERLQAAGSGSSAPVVGDHLPGFILPDDRGRLVSSEKLLDQGILVISFNRGHWCEYCQIELRALQQIVPQAAALGASIVSVTPELGAGAARTKALNKLSFPVLCDLDLGLAMALGLVIPIGKHIETLLADDGIHLSQLHGGLGGLLPIPATFVVGRDGRIAARCVDPDFRRRMDTAGILAGLAATGARATVMPSSY